MGLKVGDRIPPFALKDQFGHIFKSEDHVGKKPLVLYFYPKDHTPGCTKQACQFKDSYEEFTDLGAEVIGISADSEHMHRSFASKYDLPFILLADTQKKVRRLFKIENSLLVLPGRETYVVDGEGKVVMVFNSINAGEHMKRALKALKGLIKS